MQDLIYARAKRGALPQDLSLEDITRLSSASLDAPNGLCSNDDPLLRRLHRLVGAGLLVPSRSEQVERRGMVLGSFGGQRVGTQAGMTTRHFVQACDLRAHLAGLGAVGPLLLDWLGKEDQAPKAKGADEPWYMPRVRSFCAVLIASGKIDPEHPDVTAKDIAVAMYQLGLWHRSERRPDGGIPDMTSLERYVRTGVNAAGEASLVLMAGRPRDCPNPEQRHLRAVACLRAIYERTNPETMTRTDPESASNFPRRSAG